MRAATALPEERALQAPGAGHARPDVRDVLFAGLQGRHFPFRITAGEPGMLAGGGKILARAAELGVLSATAAADGTTFEPGETLFSGRGDAWQVARSEEQLIAVIAKTSGVATAAARLAAQAGPRARIVCGAWKKVPFEVRADLRSAAATGGVGTRILECPFVYLDKNVVRMTGGIGSAVRRAVGEPGRAVVVQLRGETAPIADEALEAAAEGAEVLMVDTGAIADLARVARLGAAGRLGSRVRIAFAGGVASTNLDSVLDAGATIVDVGRAILDAPMLDLRLDVT
jgi:nicotinate-nucleotide pyrophosphorylase (carboxylating)